VTGTAAIGFPASLEIVFDNAATKTHLSRAPSLQVSNGPVVWLIHAALDFLRRTLRYMRMTEPLGPFIIDGKPYHHVARATQIIGPELISEATLSTYADKGRTPFGLDLDVVRQPLLKTGHRNKRSSNHREVRLLIPEAKVLALKELLHDHRRNRYGPIPARDFDELKRAARRYNISQQPALHHPQHS
jgi:hypothetical protein